MSFGALETTVAVTPPSITFVIDDEGTEFPGPEVLVTGPGLRVAGERKKHQ